MRRYLLAVGRSDPDAISGESCEQSERMQLHPGSVAAVEGFVDLLHYRLLNDAATQQAPELLGTILLTGLVGASTVDSGPAMKQRPMPPDARITDMADVDPPEAIAASERAYGLLLWLGDLVNTDRVSVADAQGILSSPKAATYFLEANSAGIPNGLRSANTALNATGGILGSYLDVSFDLSDETAMVRKPDPVCGPGCPWCWHVEKGPHLTPKKLTTSDRRRADAAIRASVARLSGTIELSLASPMIESVIAAHPLEAATVAYLDELVGRASGRSSGPWALALWRRIAWEGGSPKRGFRITIDLVDSAEQTVISALNSRGISARLSHPPG